MSALLPHEPPVDPEPESQVVSLRDAGSGAVFSVLSSEAARSVLRELYRDPATKSELADRLDTSIQNVSYHLGNLVDAGLVDVVGEWYSEKGRAMDVYAPEGALVLVVGDGDVSDDGTRGRASADPVTESGD